MPSLTNLPKELLTQIGEYLSLKELCQLNSTAKFFQPVVNAILIKKLKSQQIKQIAGGMFHSLFLQQDGSIWGCGGNSFGQLGIGNAENQNKPVKVLVEEVQQVIAGYGHTLFLKTDGTVWACGYNYSGQLGIGNHENQNKPHLLPKYQKLQAIIRKLQENNNQPQTQMDWHSNRRRKSSYTRT